MKKQTHTANDMIIDVHELHKKYRVNAYYDSLKNAIISRCRNEIQRQDAIDSFNSINAKNAPEIHQTILNQIDTFDDDDQIDIIDEIQDLNKSYKYEEYCQHILNLKKEFMSHRENYFCNKFVCSQIIERTPSEISQNPKSFRDQILSLWLDLSLEKIKPNYIEITYEDLDGKIKKIHAKHQEPRLTDEYIESKPIDRYIGVGFLDSFYIHGFYDRLTNSYVSVPISLIIDMYSTSISELSRPEDNEDDRKN